jgi:hypothetical protein
MKKVSHKQIFSAVFMAISISIITLNIASSSAVLNLDGDSQPNRIKLSECMADVREVTGGWEQQRMNQAATAICDARKAHAKEKVRFLGAISKLEKQYKGYTNYGYDKHVKVATQNSWNIVKNCIEFREGFTHPHNVGVYRVPNEIRKSCYGMGTGLVESQLEVK